MEAALGVEVAEDGGWRCLDPGGHGGRVGEYGVEIASMKPCRERKMTYTSKSSITSKQH